MLSAVMAELADAQDLGSCVARRMGSSPTNRMKSPVNIEFSEIFNVCGVLPSHSTHPLLVLTIFVYVLRKYTPIFTSTTTLL